MKFIFNCPVGDISQAARAVEFAVNKYGIKRPKGHLIIVTQYGQTQRDWAVIWNDASMTVRQV